MKQIQLTLLLSPAQYDRMNELAKLTGATLEDVVRESIRSYDHLVSEHFRNTKFFEQRVGEEIEPMQMFKEEGDDEKTTESVFHGMRSRCKHGR
jgi:predicted DNA-binding protein